MGRSGQLVRPCWLDAGGVAGGEQLVARLVVRLVQASFFGQMRTHLGIVFTTFLVDFVFKMTPNPQKMGVDREKRKKLKKGTLKSENTFCRGGYFGIQNRQKWAKMRCQKNSKK